MGAQKSTKAHTTVDSQKYLVRQRRNRVWACAQLNTGVDPVTYRAAFRRVMSSFQTDVHFPMSSCFDLNLPQCEPNTKREDMLKERSVQHYQVSGR